MLLENKFVSYEFCDKCGSLIQITNKTTGKKYFNYNTENREINPWKKLTPEQYECDSSIHRLVKLIVPTEDHIGKPIYSHHAKPIFTKTENKEPVPISNTNIELEPYSVGIILYKK